MLSPVDISRRISVEAELMLTGYACETVGMRLDSRQISIQIIVFNESMGDLEVQIRNAFKQIISES
jgi:hypothetical protein